MRVGIAAVRWPSYLALFALCAGTLASSIARIIRAQGKLAEAEPLYRCAVLRF